MTRVAVVLFLVLAMLWEVWANVVRPIGHLVRRYGWHKGIGFYRFLKHEALGSPDEPDERRYMRTHLPHGRRH